MTSKFFSLEIFQNFIMNDRLIFFFLFFRSGYNKWRDAMKPTQILSKLCKEGKIDGPVYSNGKVSIGRKTFSLSNEEMECYVHSKGK